MSFKELTQVTHIMRSWQKKQLIKNSFNNITLEIRNIKLKIFQRPGENISSRKILLTQKYCICCINDERAYLTLSGLFTINGLSNVMASCTMALFTRQITLE